MMLARRTSIAQTWKVHTHLENAETVCAQHFQLLQRTLIVTIVTNVMKALNATMDNARHLYLSLALLTELAALLAIVKALSLAGVLMSAISA